MATAVDFNKVLKSFGDVSDIKRPDPLPIGSYKAIVTGEPEYGTSSSEKQTPYAGFKFIITEAMEDVDQEELEKFGEAKIAEGKAKISNKFWLTEGSIANLKEFIEHCGVEVEDKEFIELIAECANCEVGINVTQQASQDGTLIFAQVNKTFALD